MAQTVLRYGKASQQRIGPYIVISKRRLPTKAQQTSPSENSFKPLENQKKAMTKVPWLQVKISNSLRFFLDFVFGWIASMYESIQQRQH